MDAEKTMFIMFLAELSEGITEKNFSDKISEAIAYTESQTLKNLLSGLKNNYADIELIRSEFPSNLDFSKALYLAFYSLKNYKTFTFKEVEDIIAA